MATIFRNLIFSIFFLVSCHASFIWADSNSNIPLVLDQRNAPHLPKHFRISKILSHKDIDWTGFSHLRIAGGSQFSKLGLQKILQFLHVKKITIVDLRQESHGFLNGNAISWYAPRNAINAQKDPYQIEWDQANLLSQLVDLEELTVYKILQKTDDDRIQKTEPVDFAVHQIFSEADLAEMKHLDYFRIYVQDFHAPKISEVDRFIEFTKIFPTNQWVYFHCRAGVGRSTTFMMMYDMMQNAKKVSFKNIVARQVAIGGKDLTKLPDRHSYKYKFALKRLKFLKLFYKYARANDDHFQTLWSEWLDWHNVVSAPVYTRAGMTKYLEIT